MKAIQDPGHFFTHFALNSYKRELEPRKALIQHGLTVEKFDFYEKLMRWSVPRPFINVMLNVRFPLSTLLLLLM